MDITVPRITCYKNGVFWAKHQWQSLMMLFLQSAWIWNSLPFYPPLLSPKVHAWRVPHPDQSHPMNPPMSCMCVCAMWYVYACSVHVCLLDLRSVPARDRLPESPPLLSCRECPSWWILSDKPCSFSAIDPPRFLPIDDTVDSFPWSTTSPTTAAHAAAATSFRSLPSMPWWFRFPGEGDPCFFMKEMKRCLNRSSRFCSMYVSMNNANPS